MWYVFQQYFALNGMPDYWGDSWTHSPTCGYLSGQHPITSHEPTFLLASSKNVLSGTDFSFSFGNQSDLGTSFNYGLSNWRARDVTNVFWSKEVFVFVRIALFLACELQINCKTFLCMFFFFWFSFSILKKSICKKLLAAFFTIPNKAT